MQNYLKKSEQRQLVQLCSKCLMNSYVKNDDEAKELMNKALEILDSKNVYKI